ncbi:MAG: hypothetical protein U0271_44940 [Polyangiaceae bacterium]
MTTEGSAPARLSGGVVKLYVGAALLATFAVASAIVGRDLLLTEKKESARSPVTETSGKKNPEVAARKPTATTTAAPVRRVATRRALRTRSS